MLRLSYIALILVFGLFLSCKNAPTALQGAEVDTARQDTASGTTHVVEKGTFTYTVTNGTVNWSGKKANGDSHEGTLSIESGALKVVDGKLQSGRIQVNMNTLTVTSIKDGGEKRDLESHLKDVDFFEVNKFPEATFVFNEALPSDMDHFNEIIVGDLTIKQKTHGVNVPVQLKIEGNDLTALSPVFSINRTKWGINFRSGLLGTLKDKLIEDNIMLCIRLSAKRNPASHQVPPKG